MAAQQAKEILLLSEMFDAELARPLGLVNRVVDDEDLDDEVARITSIRRRP